MGLFEQSRGGEPHKQQQPLHELGAGRVVVASARDHRPFEPNMLASSSLNPGSSKVTRFFACKCDATRAVSACLAALSPRRSTDTPDGVCVAHTFPASPAAGVTTTSVEVQAQSHLASNIATVAWLLNGLLRGMQEMQSGGSDWMDWRWRDRRARDRRARDRRVNLYPQAQV